MRDRLEQFIKDQRDEFDVFEPRAELWNGVQEKMQQQNKFRKLRWFAAAATLLVLVSVGMLVMRPVKKEVYVDSKLSNMNSQLRDAEVYYTSVVAMKRTELKNYCGTAPQLCDEFDQEIDTLHSMFRMLKQEYYKSPQKEKVLHAIFLNLQRQVAILNQQMEIIKQVKEEEQQPVIKTM